MKEILFLAHRMPYPPDKGDKIRSYHMLAHLARSCRVHLGAFVDSRADWRHVERLRELCGETCFVPLSATRGALRCLRGIATGEALTVSYYGDRRLGAWVRQVSDARPIHAVVVFSSSMAQHVRGCDRSIRRIIDFVDVDSDKWRQYGKTRRWPVSAVFRREARKLGAAERAIAREFDASVLVSRREAALFEQGSPDLAGRIGYVENGVDTDFFDPHRTYPDPYSNGAPKVVFVGRMDYWPNVDAVRWFARDALPAVRREVAASEFWIVGARPSAAVRKLTKRAGVHVTGAVADVRPYLAHADVVVVPIRIARGVQNKALEALAMARPLVATTAALSAIEGSPCGRTGPESAEAMASDVIDALRGGLDGQWCARAREFILSRHDWPSTLHRLTEIVGGRTAPADLCVTR